MTETWDIEKVAELMGITKDAAYHRRTYRPELMPPAIKVGRFIRFDPETVRAWMKEHTEQGMHDRA
ncbi:helix-turn-helix transcriptional regulator [Bifidobacterium sp.]|uniref:helix-turn-helix transcriptional regulator n=1 Tax=Bifidobacterium sp. TaxID=41200 RepID=UPI003D7E6815